MLPEIKSLQRRRRRRPQECLVLHFSVPLNSTRENTRLPSKCVLHTQLSVSGPPGLSAFADARGAGGAFWAGRGLQATPLTVQEGGRVPADGASRGPGYRERAAAAGPRPAPKAPASSSLSSSALAVAPGAAAEPGRGGARLRHEDPALGARAGPLGAAAAAVSRRGALGRTRARARRGRSRWGTGNPARGRAEPRAARLPATGTPGGRVPTWPPLKVLLPFAQVAPGDRPPRLRGL